MCRTLCLAVHVSRNISKHSAPQATPVPCRATNHSGLHSCAMCEIISGRYVAVCQAMCTVSCRYQHLCARPPNTPIISRVYHFMNFVSAVTGSSGMLYPWSRQLLAPQPCTTGLRGSVMMSICAWCTAQISAHTCPIDTWPVAQQITMAFAPLQCATELAVTVLLSVGQCAWCTLQVWASKWGDRAWLSRKARSVADSDLYMACLLQQVHDHRQTTDPSVNHTGSRNSP